MNLPTFFSILIPIALLAGCEGEEDQSPFSEQSIRADFQSETAHGNLALEPEVVADINNDYIFQIKYHTEGHNNKLQIATALVIVPQVALPEGGFPVLLWNHGTIGLPDDCSPSSDPRSSYLKAAKFPTRAVGPRNYITIIPDYDGYHVDGEVHHYASHEVNARSSLDAIQSLLKKYDSLNKDKLVIAGYSQGGGVTLRALQIQKQYAPDVTFAMAMPIAPGTDTLAHMKHMATATTINTPATNRFWAIAAMQLFAVSRYENADKPAGQKIERFMSNDNSQTEINNALESSCSDELLDLYTLSDFSPAYQKHALTNNWGDTSYFEWFEKRIEGNFTTTTPIIVVGGTHDEIIAPQDNRALVARLKSKGNKKVAFIELTNGNHGGIVDSTELLLYKTMTAFFADPNVTLTTETNLTQFNLSSDLIIQSGF